MTHFRGERHFSTESGTCSDESFGIEGRTGRDFQSQCRQQQVTEPMLSTPSSILLPPPFLNLKAAIRYLLQRPFPPSSPHLRPLHPRPPLSGFLPGVPCPLPPTNSHSQTAVGHEQLTLLPHFAAFRLLVDLPHPKTNRSPAHEGKSITVRPPMLCSGSLVLTPFSIGSSSELLIDWCL